MALTTEGKKLKHQQLILVKVYHVPDPVVIGMLHISPQLILIMKL